MRKRGFFLLAALVLLTALTGCGRGEEKNTAQSVFAPVEADTAGSAPDRYVISALTYEEGALAVTLSADGPCGLKVSVLQEDGVTFVHGVETALEGAEEETTHTFPLEGGLPETFLLTAVLTGEDGAPLSDVFVNRMYTAAYRAFFAVKPTDPRFADKVVLDFDGDTTNDVTQTENFGVLADGVREDASGQVEVSEDRTSYTYTSETAPKVGEVLYLSGGDVPDLVKVGSVTDNGGGSYTVTRDPDASLDDYYSFIKLSIGGETDGEIADTVAAGPAGGLRPALLSANTGRVEDSIPGLTFPLGSSLTVKPFEASISGAITVRAELNWDPDTLGPDYIYWSLSVEGDIKLSCVIKGELSNDDLAPEYKDEKDKDKNKDDKDGGKTELPREEDPLYGGGDGSNPSQNKEPQIKDLNRYQQKVDGEHLVKLLDVGGPIPQVPGLFYEVSAGVNLTCKIEGSAGVEATITWKKTFVHETGCPDKKGSTQDVKCEPKLEGSGSISIGPVASVKLGLLDRAVYGDLTANAALVVKGELDGMLRNLDIEADADSKHACQLCVDGDIHFEITANATLGFKLSERVSGKFFDVKLVDKEFTIAEFYLSLLCDWAQTTPEHPAFGWGDCPYRSYRVKFVSTLNGRNVNGAEASVSGGGGENLLAPSKGTTPFEIMLYPGTYHVDAVLEGREFHTDITVGDAPQTETLLFKIATLRVAVVRADNGQPISGAAVEITGEKGGTLSDSTDGEGAAEFKPPLGKYKVRAAMTGFKTAQAEVTVGGEDQTLRLVLQKDEGTGTLEGYVSTTAAWEPLPDVTVTARCVSEERDDVTLLTAEDGTYSVVLPVGRYELTYTKRGYATCHAECDIEKDATVVQDIRMPDNPGFLHLTVTMPDGSSSEDIEFEVVDARTYENASQGRLRDGLTYIGDNTYQALRGGDYILRLYPHGWAYSAVPFTIDGDVDMTVEVKPITERNDGLCGDDAYWRQEGSTLYIFGHGKLDDEEVEHVLEEYGATSVVVEEGITKFYTAFMRNTALASVRLPSTVKRVYGSSFIACTNLREVILPDGIMKIKDYAFAECEALTHITLPSTLEELGYGVFQDCSSLMSIRIPDHVECLEKYAFKGCTSLARIYIPLETTVGWHAFEECTMLEATQGIYYQGTERDWEDVINPGGLGGIEITVDHGDGKGEVKERREFTFTPHFNASPDDFA